MDEGDEIAKQARRLAREQAFTPERFLADLEQGRDTEVEFHALPEADRALLIPALRAMVEARGGKVRLDAGRALFELNDPLGCDVLVDGLQSEDPDLRRGALERLIATGIGNRMRKYPLPIDADAITTALEPSLADADPRTRRNAISLLDYLATPRALDRLAELTAHPSPDVRAEAAIGLARCGLDRGALGVIEQLLCGPESSKTSFAVGALEDLCKSSDPAAQTRAVAIATRYARENLSATDYMIANHVWHCLTGIAAAGMPGAQDLLREVLSSALPRWVRGVALAHLARLEGPTGIERLVVAVSDPELSCDALKELSSLAAGSGNQAIIEALTHEMTAENPQNLSALVETFIAVGGDVDGLLDATATQVDPPTAMTIHWLRAGLDPRQAAEMLRPAFGGTEPSPEQMAELEAEWREKPDALGAAFGFFHTVWQRLVCFDSKDVVWVDHGKIAADLSGITGGRFVLTDVAQTERTARDADFQVLFVHEGVGYSLPLRGLGRYVDVRGLLDGLNGVLGRIGYPERFFEIHSYGTTMVLVTFARAEEFRAAVRDLRIPLEHHED